MKWRGLRFGELRVRRAGDSWSFEVQVYCDEVDPVGLRVELWAEGQGGAEPVRIAMRRREPIAGARQAFIYAADAPAARPAAHYTPRLLPVHPDAILPLECPLILWRDVSCPSCCGRRMSDAALHLTERVLPEVPLRHWVCSLPFQLRHLLGYDGELCAAVLNAFVKELSRSYRRRAKQAHALPDAEAGVTPVLLKVVIGVVTVLVRG